MFADLMRQKQYKSLNQRVESRAGYLFIAPLFAFLIVFTFFPAFFSFYISLFHYDPFGHSVYFVGFSNYVRVINNGLFLYSIANVFYYTAVVVTAQTFLGFFLALLFNNRLPASRIGRALVYLPAISSPVAMSLIFIWVFSPSGLANTLLLYLGLPHNLNYLYNTTLAFPAIMALNIYSTAPYFMLFYMAGIQAIPNSVLEAASLDGVRSSWHRFRYIYFPLLKFTTTLVVLLGLIGCIQLFDQVYVMTLGGPANATLVPLMLIYNYAFNNQGSAQGLAAGASFIIFAIIMVLTITQRNFLRDLAWT